MRHDNQNVLTAITRVDGTRRLQTVRLRTNPRYYKLSMAFRVTTGGAVLLDTSFNEKEPLVDTTEQALDCFLRMRVKVIVMDNTVIRLRAKDQASTAAIRG